MDDSHPANAGTVSDPDSRGEQVTSRLVRLHQTGVPYYALPEGVDTPQYADIPWRIILEPVDLAVQPLGLTLQGDVIIGASRSDLPNVDLNLASWQGCEHGVSRRHLALRPTIEAVLVEDLDSTNGSHLDGYLLEAGDLQPLTDGVLLSLGLLQLRVLFVQQPGD